MNDLPLSIHKSIQKYEPVTYEGLTLYPILVKNFDYLTIGRPALEVLHQSLPVRLMKMPLLSALYCLDHEAVMSGKTPVGLFPRALLVLALSLRLGEGLDPEGRVGLISAKVDRSDPARLLGLQFTDNDGKEHFIKPPQYRELRQIIAAQNGVHLESDEANPQIVQALKNAASGNIQLDASVDALISAVAALSGTEEADIDEWPILKLTKRSETYRRILEYIVCGVQEGGGATWKNGNPVPHPFFEKLDNGSGLFTPLGGGSADMPAGVRQIVHQTQNL